VVIVRLLLFCLDLSHVPISLFAIVTLFIARSSATFYWTDSCDAWRATPVFMDAVHQVKKLAFDHTTWVDIAKHRMSLFV
jgi:hypothetical protein